MATKILITPASSDSPKTVESEKEDMCGTGLLVFICLRGKGYTA